MIPFANALPKSGTNLLQRLLELLGYRYANLGIASSLILGKYYPLRQILRGAHFDRNPITIGFEAPVAINSKWLNRKLENIEPGAYISGHANYTERFHQILLRNKVKTIVIIRDPRAVLVSGAHYFGNKKDYYLYPVFKNQPFETRIEHMLKGGYYKNLKFNLDSFPECLRKVDAWIGKEEVLIVRFEDLVGEKGGGEQSAQIKSIQAVETFLELPPRNKQELSFITQNLFGGTHTFRKGRIDSWRDELTPALLKKIDSSLGPFIEKWGYASERRKV